MSEYKDWVVNNINNMESPNNAYTWGWIRDWMLLTQDPRLYDSHHCLPTWEDIAILLSQTLKETNTQ